MTFDPPHLLRGLMCDSTQWSLCPSLMGIHQCMWIQGSILQMTNQRSLTPDDLWPHICWGLMCDSTQGSLCPSPMKIHQSMCIQWPFLKKTWSKDHWPPDDLWPHICWGHICDSTQGSLCPIPMGIIHQCMWPSDQFCKFTTYILHTTYIHCTYYVQNQWLHSLTQARQKTPIIHFNLKFVQVDFWIQMH